MNQILILGSAIKINEGMTERNKKIRTSAASPKAARPSLAASAAPLSLGCADALETCALAGDMTGEEPGVESTCRSCRGAAL